MRKLGLGVALGVATIGFAAAPALAGQGGSLNAVTHSSDHPDTTSVAGPCTGTSSNGPVWAYDNLSLRLNVVPDSTPGSYAVTIYAHGSFTEISDPITGSCASGHGSVDGWYQLQVSSPNAPDPAAVPSQEPGDMGQGAIVEQLFDNDATVVGGHYHYTYNRIDGGKYIQNG